MLNKKEITSILVVTLILGVLVSLLKSINFFVYTLFLVLLVILINILAKKVYSFYLDSEVEVRLWEVKRYSVLPGNYFKKPVPAGLLFPIILAVLTLGNLVWMASLVFEVKPKVYRAAKRFGLYTFSEMTEHHIALIAASGILLNLFFAIIGYMINLPEFAKLNIYYAAYNMIPLSDLDGNKIFFGSFILWSFLAAVTLIALGYAIFLI